MLEAEALFVAGAVVAALGRLEPLHRQGDTAATLALARRRHTLGDYDGAQQAAATMPLHAHAALIGARAALMLGRHNTALRFAEPFLTGAAPVPEPAVAGALAVVVSTILARLGEHQRLRHLAESLLGAGDLPDDMMPTTARVAWTAGLAEQAWNRFGGEGNPWMTVARLELATLAGNSALASGLLKRAGPLGAPARTPLQLIKGERDDSPGATEAFGNQHLLHVWRTHPHRWQPWIEAAQQTPAHVEVYDLAAGELPDEQAIPRAMMDDGSLSTVLAPIPVAPRPVRGNGVWVDERLCTGIGIGHDWPAKERHVVAEHAVLAPKEQAAVWVVGVDAALAHASEGRGMVVVAPPGDPFWAGPLPERAWPAMRVVRADSRDGWTGAGQRVVDATNQLLGAVV